MLRSFSSRMLSCICRTEGWRDERTSVRPAKFLRAVFATLNLLPTLMKLSFPAFCFTSLLLLELPKRPRMKASLDSLTRDSSDMCRASLFFSTNLVCTLKEFDSSSVAEGQHLQQMAGS